MRSATPLRDQVPGVTADTSPNAGWKNMPANTRYVAHLRSKKYFMPQRARFYYQTEAAAQADGYTAGEC